MKNTHIMENNLQEKLIDILGTVMEVTEHQRKFDYWNDKSLNSRSYTDPKIWIKGNYDLFQTIELAKSQALLGEVELSSYTIYKAYMDICDAAVPHVLSTSIEVIAKVKSLVETIKETYKNTSESESLKYKEMFAQLDMEISPKEMGNFYGQLSNTIKELTASYKDEYRMFKTYHAYGSDVIPMDAKFETPLTILSGFYPEVWLNNLITQQKALTIDQMDNNIRINLYNVKDIFDETYEYFIIAVTYKSTLFIVNDEIKHPNIWARFQCRARNNRRVEERFENITLPYDAIANFEVTRKNDKKGLSKVKTITLSQVQKTDPNVIDQAVEALKELGYVNIRTSEIKSRGNYQSIVAFFDSANNNIAVGNISGRFIGEKDMNLIIFDKLIVTNTIDIKTLENFEKLFFPVFGMAIRTILSAMNGDYSQVQKGEFGTKQLLLSSGQITNDEQTFDWNNDFDSKRSSEERLEYVNRYLKHAKQLEQSGTFTGKEIALIDKVTELQLNHETGLRHIKNIDDFSRLFPVIGVGDNSRNQAIWLSLENERERIQDIFNKLDAHYKSLNTTNRTMRSSPYYMEIGEHIYDYKESFIKYAFDCILNDRRYSKKVTRFGHGGGDFSQLITTHIKNANENKEDAFATWRCDYHLNSCKEYMRAGNRYNDTYSVFDTYEENKEIDFCRVIVTFYTAEQICEALGHDSVDQLPLAWRSFLWKQFKMYGGNSNLDNVHPFTEFKMPETLTQPLKIGIIMSKQEYVNLLKTKGESHK